MTTKYLHIFCTLPPISRFRFTLYSSSQDLISDPECCCDFPKSHIDPRWYKMRFPTVHENPHGFADEGHCFPDVWERRMDDPIVNGQIEMPSLWVNILSGLLPAPQRKRWLSFTIGWSNPFFVVVEYPILATLAELGIPAASQIPWPPWPAYSRHLFQIWHQASCLNISQCLDPSGVLCIARIRLPMLFMTWGVAVRKVFQVENRKNRNLAAEVWLFANSRRLTKLYWNYWLASSFL